GDTGVLDPLFLGPGDDLLGVERYQAAQEWTPVAVHHRLRHVAVLLHRVLPVGRSDVLATRRDDDVLLATGDEQVAVLVDLAEVAGVQPAVDHRLLGRVVVLVIAPEDVRALDQYLAVLGDLDFAARHRPADRTDLVVLDRRDRGGSRGLGHAVALHHGHA